MSQNLKRVRIIADYQFGKGAGVFLFPDDVKFQMSSTNRVRQILLNDNRIATLRAKDGMLTLSIYGAKKLHEFFKYPKHRVVINKDVIEFVSKGKNAFAKHVIYIDSDIRPNQEVLIVDENDNLIATGRTMLSASEIISFKKGIAVDVRAGISK